MRGGCDDTHADQRRQVSLALIETQRVKWDQSRRGGGGESERWGRHRVYSGATWSAAVIPGPGPSVCVVRRLDGWMRAWSTHQQWKPQRIMLHRLAATGGQSVWGENANEDKLQPDFIAFVSDHTVMDFVEVFEKMMSLTGPVFVFLRDKQPSKLNSILAWACSLRAHSSAVLINSRITCSSSGPRKQQNKPHRALQRALLAQRRCDVVTATSKNARLFWFFLQNRQCLVYPQIQIRGISQCNSQL